MGKSKSDRLLDEFHATDAWRGATAKAIAYEVARGRTVPQHLIDAYIEAEKADDKAFAAWNDSLREDGK